MIFSEVHAQEEKTDKEGSYYDTVFKGLFFIFNYDLLKKQIYLSFVNGKLYLAIYVKEDLFEAPVLGTVLNYELLQEIFEYLQLGKEIAEDLIIYLGEALNIQHRDTELHEVSQRKNSV